MKILFIGVAALLSIGQAAAQSGRRAGQPAPMDGCPKVYIGTSTGLEHPTGLLGVNMDLAFHPRVSVGGGIGRGSWGTKMAAEGRYYFGPCNRGAAVGVGLTTSSGTSFLTELETLERGQETVRIFGKRVSTTFVAGYYFFKLSKGGSRAFLQGGYPQRIAPLEYGVNGGGAPGDPTTLTRNAENVVSILAPGGIMAGLGLSFALGK